jgi:hypothetical protein
VAKDSFDLILQIGAGTGLLYILRWFWWRITAWCEVAAMVSSFGISVLWLVLARQGHELPTHGRLLLTVAFTTACWLITAFVGPRTDEATLVAFYRKIRPFGPGWRRIRALAGSAAGEAPDGDSIPLALLGWLAGCFAIWSSLFAVGNLLYGRTGYALACIATFALSGLVLLRVTGRLWRRPEGGLP